MAKPVKKSSKKSSAPKEKSAESTILIKKYPNRRLYNTTTSSYIVLDDIVELVKSNVDFVIEDKKTGDDITRSILNQIIFEQEIKPSNFHFPLEVQKQLISMYGDTYGQMVPDYLTESMNLFVAEKSRMADAMENVVGKNAQAMMQYSQNLARQNMELFRKSWEMFGAIAPTQSQKETTQKPDEDSERSNELEEIQSKIDALQQRLQSLK